MQLFLMALVKEWLRSFSRTLGRKIRFESTLFNTSRLPDGKRPDTSEPPAQAGRFRISDNYISHVKSHHGLIDTR
jgi:hypothetical protein